MPAPLPAFSLSFPLVTKEWEAERGCILEAHLLPRFHPAPCLAYTIQGDDERECRKALGVERDKKAMWTEYSHVCERPTWSDRLMIPKLGQALRSPGDSIEIQFQGPPQAILMMGPPHLHF